jgi:putative NAD(P)H nitroreductase
MLLMLIAKEKGWDTCPMIGFDPEALSEALHIPDTHVPTMLIAIGKEDTSSQRPRGYRKPVGEFVSYNQF